MTTDGAPWYAGLASFLHDRVNEDQKRPDYLKPHTEACDYWGDMPGSCTCDLNSLECEAKRRIITRCDQILRAFDKEPGALWGDVKRRERHHAQATLEVLGSIYQWHPLYRPQWTP